MLVGLFKKQNKIHFWFRVTLIFKGIFAALETIGGVAVLFISKTFIMSIVFWFTNGELSADPHDFFAHQLLRWAQQFSLSSQHFLALFLVSHGIIKIILVAGLFKEKLGFYPLAISVFIFFIGYQLVRYAFTHSILLLAVTAIDVAVVWLAWEDYKLLLLEK